MFISNYCLLLDTLAIFDWRMITDAIKRGLFYIFISKYVRRTNDDFFQYIRENDIEIMKLEKGKGKGKRRV